MLLRFGCSNFRSISNYQEILLTSTTDDDTHNVFTTDAVREDVLPMAAIYGANGAGKTNTLKALSFFVQSVIFNTSRDFESISIPTFKLDSSFKNQESTFDIDFILDDKHYHYGYSVLGDLVVNEWLYSYSYSIRQSRTVLFYRDIEDEDEKFYFSKNLKGKNKTISSITDDSTLFISLAAKSGNEICSDIIKYFTNSYNFRFRTDINENSIAKKISKHDLVKDIEDFLKNIDIGVISLSTGKKEIDEKEVEMRDKIKQALILVTGDNKNDSELKFKEEEFKYYIEIEKIGTGSEKVKFDFDDESLGTKSLISLLASIFLVIRRGGVFVVDELELSLHTLLSLKVIEIFNSKKINSNGAQLIFSTHETQLLCSGLLRKDEIWLAERSLDGSSVLTALSDFAIPNKSNIRNGYLNGRFGAIPFLSSLENIEKLWS